MGGSQGEIAHVDLYKDDEIIRVLLDRSAGFGEKPDGVRLIVGRNTDRIRMNCFDTLGKFRYIWLYKVRAKPVTENYATKEGKSITRQTGEVEWTAIRRTHDNQYQAVADEDENGVRPDRVLLTVA